MLQERDYYLGFSNFPGIGPLRFRKLLAEFGSAKNAWEAAKSVLAKLLGEKLGGKFDEFRNKFSIEEYIEKLKRAHVWFLTLTDKEYPELLKRISNPPFLLYGKGDKEILRFAQNDSGGAQNDTGGFIAVVGTRKITQYGREVTESLTRELASSGFTIVSGLAMGVDAVAHRTALESGGKTIAVLGCGVDCCTPEENQSLYRSIIDGGSCIVSEYPLGQMPTRGSFPARNRIIAGLSQGVLVTE